MYIKWQAITWTNADMFPMNILGTNLTFYVLNCSEGKKIYSHFMSFHHIDMTQVVEILPQVRQELTYTT